jgi:hypothetical protein
MLAGSPLAHTLQSPQSILSSFPKTRQHFPHWNWGVQLMAEGKRTSQIAHPSHISLKAVDTYRPRIAKTVELLEHENKVFFWRMILSTNKNFLIRMYLTTGKPEWGRGNLQERGKESSNSKTGHLREAPSVSNM